MFIIGGVLVPLLIVGVIFLSGFFSDKPVKRFKPPTGRT